MNKNKYILFTSHMRLTLALLIALCLTSSCSPSREKMAEKTFNEAVDAYMNRRFNKAKILLDSVLYTYPDLKGVVRESKDMLEIIYKTEQERNLLFLDSLLNIREQEIKPLMAQFEAEDRNADNSSLIHKTQTASRAWERSYIRAHVDKNGTFYISSHYTGNGHINHHSVKAVIDDSFQQTDSISEEAYIHSFDNGDNSFEIVKYKNGADNGLGSFVASNFDKPIDIVFIGERTNIKYRMTDIDKTAFRETYQLAMMLREMVQIKSQIRNVKLAMKKQKKNISDISEE